MAYKLVWYLNSGQAEGKPWGKEIGGATGSLECPVHIETKKSLPWMKHLRWEERGIGCQGSVGLSEGLVRRDWQ